MSRPILLVIRPEPGAAQTAKLAFDQGWRPIAAPIFRIQHLAWDAPDPAGYDAVIVTSANAVREGGKALSKYRDMPAYAVGNATARALKAAGFNDIRTGPGNVATLLDAAADNGVKHALHLAGEDYRDSIQERITLDRRILYRSAPIEKFSPGALAALLEGRLTVLLHSGRAAEYFATLSDAAGAPRDTVAIAALSPAIADAAGTGWRAVAVAAKPDDIALLAAAARLCQ